MAEQEGVTGADEPLGNSNEGAAPQVGIISQYVKDLSFENPNAPAVYQWQAQPQIDVQFNIGAQKLGDEVHEVAIKMEIAARAEGQTAFQVELVYAGLFGVRNVPEEQLQPFLLAEAPRLLFPYARRVVSDAVTDGGFPPLLLDPIDFGALYMQRAALQQAEGGQSQAPEITGQA
jgi:preprotein translocase subunit SecB